MKNRMLRLMFATGIVALVTGCCCSHCSTAKTDAPTPHIIAKIADCDRYESLNPRFKQAFAFMKRPDLASLKLGKYEIDGKNCWATISEVELTPLAGAKAEIHRKYIDIQVPITGPETMGLFTMDEASKAQPFSEEYDCAMLDVKTRPIVVHPGEFAIFFPPDGAHAPSHTEGSPHKIRKLVIKVLNRAD